MASKEKYEKGYGKRPLWQWILIYIVIGLVIYALIYYFVIAKRTGNSTINYNYSPSVTTPTTVPQTTNAPTYKVPGY